MLLWLIVHSFSEYLVILFCVGQRSAELSSQGSSRKNVAIIMYKNEFYKDKLKLASNLVYNETFISTALF